MSFLNEERLEEAMKKEGLDVLIATSIENIHYATNYRSFTLNLIHSAEFLAVIPREGLAPRALIAPVSEIDLISEKTPEVQEIIPYGVFSFRPQSVEETALNESDMRLIKWGVPKPKYNSAIDALKHFIDSHNLQKLRIGIDQAGIGYSGFERIKEALLTVEIKPAYSVWQWIRMVKTSEEIERLRKAVAITELGIKETIKGIRNEVKERELEEIYLKTVIDQGARPSFAVIGFGTHSAYPNAAITDRKLKKGDTVRYDIGCTYDGYHADISRTVIFGKPSTKIKDFYNAILMGEETAINAIRPGIKAKEIFDIAVETTRKMGINDYERNHVGHGIGIEVYDPPVLNPHNETVLEEGMVFCVETPFYEIGWSGLQIEDTVVVRNDGPEYLTTMGRELIIL
jgi:Xaa-Pro aminopeptidase